MGLITRILHRRRDLVNCFLLFQSRDLCGATNPARAVVPKKSRPAKTRLHANADHPPFPRYPRNPFVIVASPSGSFGVASPSDSFGASSPSASSRILI
jgi:hypothetical protein